MEIALKQKKQNKKKTREPIFLPICLKSRSHSSPRWLSFKGKADTASTLNCNCENISTFKRPLLLAAAGLTRRRERGPNGRGLGEGRGTRVGAPGCGRRGAESPRVLHVRSEVSFLRQSAQSAVSREGGSPWWGFRERMSLRTTQGDEKKKKKNLCGCAWRRQKPGGDTAPVAPLATPTPSVIRAEHLQAQGALVVAQREGSVFGLFFSPSKEKILPRFRRNKNPLRRLAVMVNQLGCAGTLNGGIPPQATLAWPSTTHVWLA